MGYLSKERQDAIDKRIEDINLRTGLSYPDYDLTEIAKALGVDVFEFDPSDSEINGVIQYRDSENEAFRPRIYLKREMQPTRKRFTLAHELGHFLLHPQKEKFRLDTYNYSLDSEESMEESEANYFAASLLVPKDRLTKVMTVTKNTEEVARYFGVSVPVIENRLKWILRNA
jgi:Zn-dependent peptidase ImmA (M78 family)